MPFGLAQFCLFVSPLNGGNHTHTNRNLKADDGFVFGSIGPIKLPLILARIASFVYIALDCSASSTMVSRSGSFAALQLTGSMQYKFWLLWNRCLVGWFAMLISIAIVVDILLSLVDWICNVTHLTTWPHLIFILLYLLSIRATASFKLLLLANLIGLKEDFAQRNGSLWEHISEVSWADCVVVVVVVVGYVIEQFCVMLHAGFICIVVPTRGLNGIVFAASIGS